MEIRSAIPWLPPSLVREHLDGLPDAEGYSVVVKPLRYRSRPHLAGLTEFDERRITLQVPEPFLPFGEIVEYGAKRLKGRGMRFVWLSEGLTFREPREVLRFVYCHEWYHWWLYERLGRKSAAETACDRFALLSYRSDRVTVADAERALRRRGDPPDPPGVVPAAAAARSPRRPAGRGPLPGQAALWSPGPSCP